MNLKQREAQREEYLYLENWLKEHTDDLMTPSYFLDELTLLNELQIQYIMIAYMIPRTEIEKEIDFYDSHNFLSKPDEIKFVSSLAQKYGVDREINIIPTGIDVDRFSKGKNDTKKVIQLRNKLGIKKEDFVLLLVSRISDAQKNIKFLLDAQKQINKKYENIKILVVGDGPDLEYFKKSYKDNKNIIFTGMVPWKDVSLYYQLGNIFVTASKTETQGLTVIEGMSASLPVICIDDDSFKIAVIEDYNGLFFKTKKDYIKCVSTLYEDKKKYLMMSKQALSSSKQFSVKIYGQKIIEVYQKAINNHKDGLIDKIKNIIKDG